MSVLKMGGKARPTFLYDMIWYMWNLLRDHAINAPSIKRPLASSSKWHPGHIRCSSIMYSISNKYVVSSSLNLWQKRANNQPNSKRNETQRNGTVSNPTNRNNTEKHSQASSSNHFAFKIKCTIEMSMKILNESMEISQQKYRCNRHHCHRSRCCCRDCRWRLVKILATTKTIIKCCCSILLKCVRISFFQRQMSLEKWADVNVTRVATVDEESMREKEILKEINTLPGTRISHSILVEKKNCIRFSGKLCYDEYIDEAEHANDLLGTVLFLIASNALKERERARAWKLLNNRSNQCVEVEGFSCVNEFILHSFCFFLSLHFVMLNLCVGTYARKAHTLSFSNNNNNNSVLLCSHRHHNNIMVYWLKHR